MREVKDKKPERLNYFETKYISSKCNSEHP